MYALIVWAERPSHNIPRESGPNRFIGMTEKRDSAVATRKAWLTGGFHLRNVRYTGTRTVARRPPSGESPSMMSPPWERAMSRAMARPSPVPPLS